MASKGSHNMSKGNREMLELVEFQNWYMSDDGREGGGPMFSEYLVGEGLCVPLPRRNQLDIVLRCSQIRSGTYNRVQDALRMYEFPSELLVDDTIETDPRYLETALQLQVFRELLDFAWKYNKRRAPVITHNGGDGSHRLYTATQQSYSSALTISEKHIFGYVKMKSNGVLRPVQRRKPRLRLVKTAAESA